MGTVADGKSILARRRVRTGDGEIVPRRWERQQARYLFVSGLQHLAPHIVAELWQDDVASYFRDASGRSIFDPAWNGEPFEIAMDIADRLAARLWEWCQHHHLTDAWCFDAAWITATAVGRLATNPDDPRLSWCVPGRTLFLSSEDLTADLYEGKEVGVPVEGFPNLVYYPDTLSKIRIVWLDNLKGADVETEHGTREDPGHFGHFDPRAETIDDAVKRLMPELEERLRRALAQMVAEDAAGDTVPVRDLPPVHHFAWTVRYQVLGESFTHIANTDRVDRKAVTKAVRKVADIIGLTLREPDEGGRPAKRARCVKLTPKQGTS